MKTFVLDFQFTGFIRQRLRIIESGWSEEGVIAGLESGRLATTISHDGVETHGQTVTDSETGVIIARIEAQRAIADSHEFSNFNDSTDIDLDMIGTNLEAADAVDPNI